MIDETKQEDNKNEIKLSRKEDVHVCIIFVLADSQSGSILSLDYREVFVATNSTRVRTCRNLLDLIPFRTLCWISQDMKQFEIESF